MAITVKALGEWLVSLKDDDLVAIDDGELTLVEVASYKSSYKPFDYPYLEIGGIPEGD